MQASAEACAEKDGLVLDTSVPMHDAGCFVNFGEHDVHFTLTSVEELDGLKDGSIGRDGRKGFLAREALKSLAPYEAGDLFSDGVELPGGGRLFFDGGSLCKRLNRAERKKFPLGEDSPDNRIIKAAWLLDKARDKRYRRIRFISKDLGQRLKARACGLVTEDYLHDRIGSIEELYKPFTRLIVSADQYDEYIAYLYAGKQARSGMPVDDFRALGIDLPRDLYPNQCLAIDEMDGGRPRLNIVFRAENATHPGTFCVVKDFFAKPNQGRHITPRNPEQHMAYQFLIDPAIELVALLGRQGTGKTLLAVQAALEQLPEFYNEIIVYRSNIELGAPMGFLPGNIGEKFAPWMRPIFDQFEAIYKDGRSHNRGKRDASGDQDKSYMQERNEAFNLMERGQLSIEPIAYIRGRSFHGKLVIVDEAQNLTPQEIKIMIGRAGAGTKIVLAGDARQVDHKYLDPFSNGLSHAADRFRGQKNFAYVALQEVERSFLAEQADSLL